MAVIKDAYIPDATRVTPVNAQNTDDVKKMTEGIKAVNEIKNVAGALSGVDAVQKELERKEKKMEGIEKEKKETDQELQETKMEVIQKELGGKIDHLSEAMKFGASTKSIGEQITDIKKTATELGLGGSKVSEFKEMASLIQSLNPHQKEKGLAEQVKDAKELLVTLQPEKEKEAAPAGMPAEIVLEIKKMDTDLKLRLEQMQDDRQRRDQDFQVTLKKWEGEREMKRQEIEGKLTVERERNELLAGGLDRFGRVIGQATSEAGVPSQPRKGAGIQAGEGEFGEITCPQCQSTVPIARDAVKAVCPGCGTPYNINRIKREIPAEQVEGAEQPEPETGSVEEAEQLI